MIAKSFPGQLAVLGPNGLPCFQWQQLLGTGATALPVWLLIPEACLTLTVPAICLHYYTSTTSAAHHSPGHLGRVSSKDA